MSAAFFAAKVELHEARKWWTVRHPRTTHPLVAIHDLLARYHGLAKAQLRSRHELLDQIVRACNNYLRGRNPKKSSSPKNETVAIAAWQANRRLEVEKQRARELALKIDTVPTRGVRVTGISQDAMRYERVAKSGGIAITGTMLIQKAEQGELGPIELSDRGNPDNATDYYALKKLLKTLTPTEIHQTGLRVLEYSSDEQRARYHVEVVGRHWVWSLDGTLVDTMDHVTAEVPGYAHYACSLDGKFYVRKVAHTEMGAFAHSSFLAGENALCAGTIKFSDGRLLEITNESGHYQPRAINLADACEAVLATGYDPRTDGYALFSDFRGEQQPPHPKAWMYRVPIAQFVVAKGKPVNPADFAVLQDKQKGYCSYLAPDLAQARGCVEEHPELHIEGDPLGCIAPSKREGCPGPRFHAERKTGLPDQCEYCKYFHEIRKLGNVEAMRQSKISGLVAEREMTMAKAHGKLATYAETLLVDLLYECGLDHRANDCALLTCGSLARGESVTFSDIDAVLILKDDNPGTISFFTNVFKRMEVVIRESGLQRTGFRFCEGGLSPVGGADPEYDPPLMGTPERLLGLINEQREASPKGSIHLEGAFFTKFIFGNRTLAQGWQAVCLQRNAFSDTTRAAALQELRQYVDDIEAGRWRIPKGGDLWVQLKDQLYRPTHMILNKLAVYYGVTDTNSRAQIQKLGEMKRMSAPVATLFLNLLEEIGRLRMEVHLAAGEEYERVRLRDVRDSDTKLDKEDAVDRRNPLASVRQRHSVLECAERLKIVLGLTKAFLHTRTHKGKRKDNPFASKSPDGYKVNV